MLVEYGNSIATEDGVVPPVGTGKIACSGGFVDTATVLLCVDSSGNESTQSSTVAVSTNPPLHAIFPVPTGGTTPSSVAIEFPYSTNMGTVAAGSEVLYVLNADGSAPVDADGQGATLGDFSVRGSYFAAGPSMAVLAPAEGMSFIAPSWGVQQSATADSAGLY